MDEALTLALAGNPNAGKTTIFNALSGSRQHVGNWPGKTVARVEGWVRRGDWRGRVVDLPGTYSLSAFSPEEVIARDYLLSGDAQVVVDVVDATNLERNLYLTAQLLELGLPVVVALNVSDGARAQGLHIDRERLGLLLGGVPVVETVGHRGRGLDALLDAAVAGTPDFRIDYGPAIEGEIESLVEAISGQPELASYPARWLAIKLLEGEADIATRVAGCRGGPDVIDRAAASRERIEAATGESADIAIADARYGHVHAIAQEVLDMTLARGHTTTDRIDRVLTSRIFGLPIFLSVMYVVFRLVVDTSAFFLDWVDAVIAGPVSRWVAGLLELVSAPDWLVSLVLDGVLAGVGAVLVFVPGLIVLYLFLALLEDSGYMARVAFVMDRLMGFTGLHGKSFMPMILGFGCAVPGVYATRTLEDRRQRILTSLLVPLMSCSARLPVFVVFGMAFFGAAAAGIITGLYFLGIVLAAVVGIIMSRTLLRARADSVFALELPPYRPPTARGLMLHTWRRTREFVVKAGTVILAVSVVLWFLMSLPWGVESQRDSYFGQVSAAMAPAFEPAGFGTWQAAGALVSGFIAKEIVVASMAQAYLGEEAEEDEGGAAPAGPVPTVAEDLREIGASFVEAATGAARSVAGIIPGLDPGPAEAPAEQDTALGAALQASFTPLAAGAFMLFVLVYTPCVATLGAIRHEFGWRWAGLSASYQLVLAWLVAVAAFQAGTLLGFG